MNWVFELVAGPYGGTSEGPAWDGQAMLFTDVPNSRIMPECRPMGILAHPPQPGSGTLAETRSPTERVVWPCPVTSSTCNMSPGFNSRLDPSPIPISI